MKCFVHPDSDALAVCKHCGRGLCADCAVESEAGISCAGECEAEVSLGYRLLRQAESNVRITQAGPKFTGAFLLVTGAAFGVTWWMGGRNNEFLLTMSALFFVMGLVAVWIWGRRGD